MTGPAATVTAVCLALAESVEQPPACLLPIGQQTLLTRLIDQLRRHGAGRIVVLTRAAWAQTCVDAVDGGVEVQGHDGPSGMLASIADIADAATGDLLVAHADVVTHDGTLAGMLADPRVRSGVLSTSRNMPGLLSPRIRITRGRVVAAESAYHSVTSFNGSLLGICKVGSADLGEASAAAREVAGLTADGLPDRWNDEFAGKVAERGAKVLASQSGLAVLADQLEASDHVPDRFPQPDALQTALAADYRLRVALPAQALRDDPLPLLVVGMIRRDVMMTSTYLREFFWDRPLSASAATAAVRALAAVDEDEILLSSAVKGSDGFFTTFFVSTYSRYVARWAARRGFTPNQVTSVSMLLGVLAALAFATGRTAGMIAGALLLQIAFTADCVDGQLARYTRRFSKLGAWLDSVFDRGKEYVVYAGLAFGATVNGAGPEIWMLAAMALALQTFRHYIDFSYAAQQHQALASSVRGSVKASHEGEITTWETKVGDARKAKGALQRLGRSGVKTSVAFERQPWRKWLKRIIALPIGERFALISLTAAIAGPRATFMWLLSWGTVAAAYTTAGRVLRSFA